MGPISWTTLEFEEKDRHPDWIWYAGLIFALSATVSFFYKNIFFGIFLVIAGALVIMFSTRKPKHISIVLDEKEIIIDEDRIGYERVKQFWIDETEKPDKLLLLVKGAFIPMVVLPLSGIGAETVRAKMKLHTQEVRMRESMGVKIADRLGF